MEAGRPAEGPCVVAACEGCISYRPLKIPAGDVVGGLSLVAHRTATQRAERTVPGRLDGPLEALPAHLDDLGRRMLRLAGITTNECADFGRRWS